MQKLTNAQEIANLIHDKTCHFNHTDQCGWLYEKWKKNGGSEGRTKQEYLKKAQAMLKIVPKETIIAIFKHL